MSNSKSVAIKINQDKLMANLQYSFSNKTTLLGELMQNSRRAGATSVSLESLDETTLRITDDGKGIDDFQNLFSVAESGWDAETVRTERPFGMGFLSCLYQAENIHIESNGQFIEGKTSEILAGGVLDVKDLADKKDATYTIVTLFNFKLSKVDVVKELEKLAEGFAITVILDGVKLLRNNALNTDTGDFIEVPGIGHINACKFFNTQFSAFSIHKNIMIYLQGLPVFDDRRWNKSEIDIVHLDPMLHFARMPDRDKLINESEVLGKIKSAINQIHLDRLINMKAYLTPEEFATKKLAGYALAIEGGVEVLSENDVRLSNYFYGQVDSVQPSCWGEHDYVESSSTDLSVSYEEVASGAVKLCIAEQLNSWDEENNCAAAWIFARKMGWSMVDGFGHTARIELLDKHWVAPLLHVLNNDNIKIQANGAGKKGNIDMDYWSCAIELCDSYTITYTAADGKDYVCEVNNEAVYTKDGVLFVPANAHDFGSSAVLQGSDYRENDDFDEETHSKDANALNLYVNMLRSGDELSSLQTLLNSVSLSEYKEFIGNKYELTLDKNCRVVLAKIAA